MATHLPFLERGQAMHSTRHTVTNELKGQRVSIEERADFAGHKLNSETTDRYFKTAPLALLREAVEKIPQVTASIVAHPLSILSAKDRQPRPARKARA